MPTPERGHADRLDLPGNLGAYSLSILGLAALLPASGRLLPERVTTLAPRTVRALATRLGARSL